MAVAITAALLTAAAAAYMASAAAIEHNERFFRAAQTARVSVNRIMADVRKCESGEVDTDFVELKMPDGQTRRYTYDAKTRTINLTFPDDPDPVSHVLARNVESAEFRNTDKAVSLVVNIEIESSRVSLSGASTPRRLMTYK
jgi:YD repeat-containing protein